MRHGVFVGPRIIALAPPHCAAPVIVFGGGRGERYGFRHLREGPVEGVFPEVGEAQMAASVGMILDGERFAEEADRRIVPPSS